MKSKCILCGRQLFSLDSSFCEQCISCTTQRNSFSEFSQGILVRSVQIASADKTLYSFSAFLQSLKFDKLSFQFRIIWSIVRNRLNQNCLNLLSNFPVLSLPVSACRGSNAFEVPSPKIECKSLMSTKPLTSRIKRLLQFSWFKWDSSKKKKCLQSIHLQACTESLPSFRHLIISVSASSWSFSSWLVWPFKDQYVLWLPAIT